MTDRPIKASQPGRTLAAVAFREYAASLHAYLTRRLHATADVADLTMEVYERFLRSPQLATVQNPRAFLFRIARHTVADAHRMDASRPLIYDSEAVATADGDLSLSMPDRAAQEFDAARELRRVTTALKQLPLMHQAVLWLAAHDELAHKEIAKRMGLSVSTVGLYVCEARARLRTMLERD